MKEFDELARRLLVIGEGLEVLADGCQEKVERLRKLNEQLRKDLGLEGVAS